jgi:hypothetical protein
VTAVYVHLKRQFAEDGEAAEVIEAAKNAYSASGLR